MCSHLRSREIRTRARSSSLTRKIGRQCRLIGDDMTERYQTNRRQNFHFEAPRLNIDPSVIFVGLVTSLHLLVILSRNGWHFLWRYWREKKPGVNDAAFKISIYNIYKIASKRKYQPWNKLLTINWYHFSTLRNKVSLHILRHIVHQLIRSFR